MRLIVLGVVLTYVEKSVIRFFDQKRQPYEHTIAFKRKQLAFFRKWFAIITSSENCC